MSQAVHGYFICKTEVRLISFFRKPFNDYPRYEYRRKERANNTNDQRYGKTFDRSLPKRIKNESHNHGSDICIYDGRIGFLITRANGLF